MDLLKKKNDNFRIPYHPKYSHLWFFTIYGEESGCEFLGQYGIPNLSFFFSKSSHENEIVSQSGGGVGVGGGEGPNSSIPTPEFEKFYIPKYNTGLFTW